MQILAFSPRTPEVIPTNGIEGCFKISFVAMLKLALAVLSPWTQLASMAFGAN